MTLCNKWPLILRSNTGGVIANGIAIFVFNKRYEREMDRLAPEGKRPAAEVRLEMALIGGPFLVIGFFILGWTRLALIHFERQ